MTWVWRIRIALILSLIALIVFTYWKGRQSGHATPTQNPVAFLPPQDEAKLIVDPVHHSIEVISRGKNGEVVTKRTFLPDRKSVVTVKKGGDIHVETRPFGTEVAPFIGIIAGGRLYATVGVNLLYFNRFEIGGGVSSDLRHLQNTRLYCSLQFNVYDNVSIGVGIDHTRNPLGLLSVKF